MTEAAVDRSAEPQDSGNTLSPMPGEPGIPSVGTKQRRPVSLKGLLAVGLLVLSLIAVSAFSIQRFIAGGKKDDAESKRTGDRPAAASTEARRLDLTLPTAASAPSPPSPRIPALVPTSEELAEPIGVRRTGERGAPPAGVKQTAPEDAPAMLVSGRPLGNSNRPPPGDATPSAEPTAPASTDSLSATNRNLQGYQRQLQGLLETLTRQATKITDAGAPASGMGDTPIGAPLLTPSAGGTAPGVPQSGGGLFGGQLQGSSTPRVAASTLGDRSLTLAKGTAFTCALTTRIVSATSGLVGCQVQRNVYSDDGRVLLVERGSHLAGEYRVTSLRPGSIRIPLLWTRLRTPMGVTVDLESPGTGPLGESGVDGHVDNRWLERVGGALLLSLIDDSVKLLLQRQTDRSDSDASNTFILPSTTSNTSKLAEKVLDSTVNIPPLIYQHQGAIVGIYVARDVDFSSVYELRPTER